MDSRDSPSHHRLELIPSSWPGEKASSKTLAWPLSLELSDNDVRFLEAMLEDKTTSRATDIAERMGVTRRYASNYKARLFAQGIIAESRRSRVEFALPGMREYVRAHRED